MRHMLGNLSPNYFERTKRYMMLRASRQGTDLTVSGTPPLSLPNSIGKPLKAWEVDVLPKQDLNGYDAPWPAGGGVNKFDEQVSLGLLNSDGSISQTTGRLVTDFIPVEAGKEYAFVWPTNIGRGRGAFYDSSKNLVQYFGDFPSDTSHVGSGYGLFTAPTGAAFLRINLTSLYGTTYNHDISVNYPSSVTTYTPYSNICPIHGTDKLNIYTDSKYGGLVEWNQQLYFDSDSWTLNGMQCSVNNGRLTMTGTSTMTATTALVPSRIYNKTKPVQGHVYALILSGETNLNNLRFNIYGTPSQTINLSTIQSVIFTCNSANANDAEFVAQYNMDEEYSTDITSYLCDLTQAFGAGNEPSTVEEFRALFPLDYYAYNAGQQMTVDQVNGAQYSPAVLTLPQTVYTGTIGSEGGVSRTAAIDMGAMTWNYESAYSRMSSNPISGLKPPTANATNADCEMYKIVTANYGWSHRDTEQTMAIDTTGYIRVYQPQTTDPQAFKLEANGKKLVYELTSPTDFSITAPTIPTPTGTATTWATAEDGTVDSMEVTYVGKA